MPVEIRVPPLGESVVEATVSRWTKREGEAVAKDEVLVELETDKITVEVAAQRAGVLGKIDRPEGETVGVNDLLGSIQESDGASPADQAGATASACTMHPAEIPSAETIPASRPSLVLRATT